MANFRLKPDPVDQRGDIYAGDPSERKKDTILIGKLIESGARRNLHLDISGEQVVAILGKRGTGKSFTLGAIMEGLAPGNQGQSSIATVDTPRAGLVFDIMDIFWSSTIPLSENGAPEVVKQFQLMRSEGFTEMNLGFDVWIPSGFENSEIDPTPINSLKIQASDLELDDWAALFNVDIFTEPRGMLVADVIAHVSRDGYLDQNGKKVGPAAIYDFDDIKKCLENDADILANYRPDTIRGIRQRMSTYSALPLFQGKGTSLTSLLNPYRVSILMLARVPDEIKKVVVAVLLRRILRSRRDASFATKRIELDVKIDAAERSRLENCIATSVPRTWVLMDEAHVLAGSSEASVAREAFVKFAKEGRNYGLSMAVATQQPSALDPRLMSQAESLILHQLTSPSDANVAIQSLKSPPPSELQVDGEKSDPAILLRRLGQGEMVFSSGNAPSLKRFCIAQTRPRLTAHGGYEA